MNIKNILTSGWTQDRILGTVYHFEHILNTRASEMLEIAQRIHVVETINGTLVMGNSSKIAKPEQVHHNKYFKDNLDTAAALAVQIAINSVEVAENVIAIRPATDDEIMLYLTMCDYFFEKESEAFSDQEAIEKINSCTDRA